MRFLFAGAGALGTYVGGALAASGHEVAFIEQPGPAATIAEHGLKLHRGSTLQTVRGITLFTDTAEALAAPHDVLVFALKSFDTATVLDQIVATGRPVPPILSLQNGVDNEPLIAQRLGADRVIFGSVATSIAKPGVGEVVEETHRGIGIGLGHPLSEPIIRALTEADLRGRPYRSPGSMKWSKLLTNLQGNALSAILDMTTGAIMADPRLYDLEMDAMAECLRVTRALGFKPVDLPKTPVVGLSLAVERLPHQLVQPILVRLLGDSRGHKMPSFHIDLHSGRGRTEVTYINGAVVRHGERLGIRTPVNRLLTQTLEDLSRGVQDVETYRHNPDALLAQIVS